MLTRLSGIVVLLALFGCASSISESEAIAAAEQKLRRWQPVPNVDKLLLMAERARDGNWDVHAMPGPNWTGPANTAFPLSIEIEQEPKSHFPHVMHTDRYGRRA